MDPYWMQQFFPQETKRRNEGKCPICDIKVVETEFRTERDLAEYKISGICQNCQDSLFGE